MNIDSLFGSSNSFPDNGIISQAYDSRVNQNDMLKASARLMRQDDAFYREELIDGSGRYTWNPDFIAGMDQVFSTGVMPSFSIAQRKLYDEYMLFADNKNLSTTSEAVLKLDQYMGSR